LGQLLKEVAEKLNRRVAIIASGDLSHKLLTEGPYGFAAEGPEFDAKITKMLGDADFAGMLEMSPQLCDAAGECGHRAFVIMAGALDCKAVKANLLSYEGPFGVGYGVATFTITGEDKERNFGVKLVEKQQKQHENEDIYVQLARRTVEYFVQTGLTPPDVPPLPQEMLLERAGAFVSLKKRGQLRGCIGTIMPVQASLALEIMRNAVSACSQDPRFLPVRADELSELVYSVDVLKPAEPINYIEELDAKKYGVIVQNGGRRGLLLPDIEGVETPQEQIAIAKQKGGILPHEEVQLFRFEVVRHK
jgi:AmmeMemoRadiSam system protein A